MEIPKIPNLYKTVDSKIDAFLILDTVKYEIDGFQIVFGQPVDHKGQPQHETKGGQFTLRLTQSVDDNIYDWAKRSNKLKAGTIQFVSDTSGTILRIDFVDAACISLNHKINIYSGTETMLVIAPSIITMSDVTHNNRWSN